MSTIANHGNFEIKCDQIEIDCVMSDLKDYAKLLRISFFFLFFCEFFQNLLFFFFLAIANTYKKKILFERTIVFYKIEMGENKTKLTSNSKSYHYANTIIS